MDCYLYNPGIKSDNKWLELLINIAAGTTPVCETPVKAELQQREIRGWNSDLESTQLCPLSLATAVGTGTHLELEPAGWGMLLELGCASQALQPLARHGFSCFSLKESLSLSPKMERGGRIWTFKMGFRRGRWQIPPQNLKETFIKWNTWPKLSLHALNSPGCY